MQRFAFPPQIHPAWKRQKKQKHCCLRGIFVSVCKVRKKNPIITENQPLSYVGGGRKSFFVAHESQECNHCALVWQCVPGRRYGNRGEVLGRGKCYVSAWKAVRLWQFIKYPSFGVVPSRHIVLVSPIRTLRARLPSLRSVVPSRHLL